MRICSYRREDGAVRVGVIDGDAVRDAGTMIWDPAPGERVGSLGEVALAAPVPMPGKVVCVGRNYAEHAAETGSAVPTEPQLFAKWANAVVGPGADVVAHPITHALDYEAELVAVIGRTASRVSESHALDHVLGYTCGNDISARDLQFGDTQWTRGKALDTFAPMGPWIVTTDEIPDPQVLGIRGLVNGETRQADTTANMVFPVARIIEFVTEAITLDPGDVIYTGTPPGVGHGRTPPVYLAPGDLMRVEIDGIGAIENRVGRAVNERPARLPPAWLVAPMLRVRDGLARVYRGIVPPAVRVLEGTFGLMETKALFTAAELGIADALADGPRSSAELAAELGADADAVGRLLRLLVSLGYFTHRPDGTWSNNAASELLRDDDPNSLRSWVRFIGSDWSWDIWNQLPHAVRTGRSGTEVARGDEFFGFMGADPQAAALFDAAMEDVSRHTAPLIAAGYDFSAVRRVCDVGGGTGSVLAAILATHEHLEGVLFDLPEVVANAGPVLDRDGVADRVQIEGGSFFESVPGGCDLYLLQSIVHDWDDESVVRILEQVHTAMPAGARVLLLEAVLPTNETLHPAKYADIMMLVLTGRGRERTRDEYADLVARAGFRLDRVVDLVLRQGIELVATR